MDETATKSIGRRRERIRYISSEGRIKIQHWVRVVSEALSGPERSQHVAIGFMRGHVERE